MKNRGSKFYENLRKFVYYVYKECIADYLLFNCCNKQYIRQIYTYDAYIYTSIRCDYTVCYYHGITTATRLL